jgi:formyl-CoA transferase
MQNAFPRFSKTPSGIRRPAPATPGQHNAEVYGEVLGWDTETLAAKSEAGII